MAKRKNATSKYNGVYKVGSKRVKFLVGKWCAQVIVSGKRLKIFKNTEREAALAADLLYIQYDMLDKLNILKPLPGGAKKK